MPHPTNPSSVRSLGIDVGGTSVKLAMTDGSNLIWDGQSPFYAKPDTRQLVDAMRAAAGDRGVSADVIGLCVPGIQDERNTRVTLSVNVPGLIDVPFTELIERAVGPQSAPIAVVNDGVATAFGLHHTYDVGGRLLVLALGTGVGMAVLDDGVPLNVEGDSAGHIGQIDVSIPGHDAIGPDGGAGGLEGYIGAPALRRRFGDSLTQALGTLPPDDPALLALVRALRICHAIYRPNHIFLAGGIGVRLKHRLPEITARVGQNLTSVARPGWTLAAAEHDFYGALGAAMWATRHPPAD